MFDYQKTFGGATCTLTSEEEFMRIVGDPKVEQRCRVVQAWKEEEHRIALCLQKAGPSEVEKLKAARERAHEEAAKAKRGLPKFLFHATFPNHRRKSEEGVPTGYYIYDWDGIWEAAPREVFEALLEQFRTEGRDFIADAKVLLAHVTPSGHGLRLVCRVNPALDIKGNQQLLADMMQVPQNQRDEAVFDLARVSYGVPMTHVLYLDKEIFGEEERTDSREGSVDDGDQRKGSGEEKADNGAQKVDNGAQSADSKEESAESNPPISHFHGVPYPEIISKYWELHHGGKEPERTERNTLTFDLAYNLRHLCGFDIDRLDAVIPCYDGFPAEEKRQCIANAVEREHGRMPWRMSQVLEALKTAHPENAELAEAVGLLQEQDENYYVEQLPERLPMGVADSLKGVHPNLSMAVLTGIGPMIGALATGVKLQVHRSMKNINLIAYIVGEAASNKSELDDLYYAWMGDLLEEDKVNLQKEDEFEELKRRKKNAKEQPERPTILVRCPSLRTSVTKILERLKFSQGKHLYSYTSESDQLSQSSNEAWNNTSVILRKAYDGAEYSQAYKSDNSVNAVIDHVLWNLTLCCTPDALYRAVPNVTDGKLTRICIGRTPDNTFAPLELVDPRTEEATKNIRAVAGVLDVMQGEIVLPKLQERCELWLEKVRTRAQKNYDVVEARQRFRIAVSTARYIGAFMLCDCAGWLISQIDGIRRKPEWAKGCKSARDYLKKCPEALPELVKRFQTDDLLGLYDVLADYFLDNALLYFRDRISDAYARRNYVSGSASRKRRGQNDTVYERLPQVFTEEQARREKGSDASSNAVSQMLKNWRKQGLIEQTDNRQYKKIASV